MFRHAPWSTSRSRRIENEGEPLHAPLVIPPRPVPARPNPDAHEAPGGSPENNRVVIIDNNDGDGWCGAVVIDLA